MTGTAVVSLLLIEAPWVIFMTENYYLANSFPIPKSRDSDADNCRNRESGLRKAAGIPGFGIPELQSLALAYWIQSLAAGSVVRRFVRSLTAGSFVRKFAVTLLIFAMSRYLFILLTTRNPNPKP